ncbi:MAG TPA: Ppx/GppA phosphatase family protein [Gemmatimonadales bacterium]|nr:Ppx/GppA phosphatase family protein [Gemmatimonadales bacterium]
MSPTTERFAAIDVGSNSIRCLIAERGEDGHLQIIDDLKDQPRLARGLSSTGVLAPESMERALESLGRMIQAAERRGAARLALVATAAVRDAANGAEFAERVKRELGIPLEVIDGETEARLAFLSVSEHFPIGRGRAVVADIGGGSLELVLAVGGLVDRVVSLPFGAVRLTEQFLAGTADAGDGVRRLRGAVRQKLRRAVPGREWEAAKLFGSGGTFTNLARVAAARHRGAVPTGGIHGSSVRLPELQRILEWLAAMSVEERRKVPGLNPERADIIVAGLAVAAEVLELFDAPKVAVSAFGLREGLLIHLSRPAPEGQAPTRARALRRFAERCHTDRRHGEQTARLARRLFDGLGKRLGCAPGEWDLLEAAALLHDVGQLVSYRSHHKHSYHLIAHAESLPFTPRERVLIALVSRYHRKRRPSKQHLEFAALEPEDRALVRRLAALLRMACGLDRGHVSAVEAMRLRMMPDRLLVDVVPRLVTTDLKLELWGAQRKADLLAKLLGREVVVRAAPLAESKAAS